MNLDENDILNNIVVKGAREHNLKNIDVIIPRNKLVVITGISGSGKSSLAFSTIYAEGQRRYIDSFNSYARQFLGGIERPDVDQIEGLSPVISIEQKSTNKNPRSTVGTITEIYDFLRLLYARASDAYSYVTGDKMVQFSEPQIIESVFENFHNKSIYVLTPLVRSRKGHYRELFEEMRKKGFIKVRIDGEIQELKPLMQVDRYVIHDIELVIDQLQVTEAFHQRLRESITTALKMGEGLMMIVDKDTGKASPYSKNLICEVSGISYDEPSPNTFSFNSPYGACPTCHGLGYMQSLNLDKIIPDPTKSINLGGIAPIGEARDTGLFRELKKMASAYKFNMTMPIQAIDGKTLNLILYGSTEPTSLVIENNRQGSTNEVWYTLQQGGLIGMMKNGYANSSSEPVRRWIEEYTETNSCPECHGTRLKKESLYFKVAEKNISELAHLDVIDLAAWFQNVEKKLSKKQKLIANDILKEIKMRIGFLLNVGLEYLTLDRPTKSLSGGESQRIRLATQIGSKLSGITYILDEPSIGLHQSDNERLITALKDLTTYDNTVVVVEHDEDIMRESDYLIEIGPKAGVHGGEIVAHGTLQEFLLSDTITAQYLAEKIKIEIPAQRRPWTEKTIKLTGCQGNNLKNVNAEFPLSIFIGVSGVSGSGKSTLINETLYPILHRHVYKETIQPLEYKKITGLEHIDKVIQIDQSPIGRTPRSNPATYIKIFDDIRNLYSELPESKIRGYKPGRFSFNVKGGRCEECQGGGQKVIEMNFLPDVEVQCQSCLGKRYNRETLEIRYKGKSIYDVLEMTFEEANEFFINFPKIHRKIQLVCDVGLSYLRIGQSSLTISGGEAQRVKLSSELGKRDTGNTFYILDEPTTGLHFSDIKILLDVLHKLVDKGNTVLVIEHNLDVLKTVDYLIDIGPKGGKNGGKIIAAGTPEQVAANKDSVTGKFLQKMLK